MNPSLRILSIAVLLCLLASCTQATPATPTAVPLPTTPASATPAPAPTATPVPPTPQPAGSPEDLVPLAQAFVDQLVQGDFAAAESRFDDTMKTALPEAKLKDTWGQLIAQVGAFQKQLGTRTVEQQGYHIVFVTCQFEQAAIDVRVVFNSQGQISGLFFAPAQAGSATPQAYVSPGYVKADAFHEVGVTVGSGEWALPGTLSVPNGTGPFPAVVLVHGSGPNDRDESIGPNKPFRDLAWGLASQGIAVLRYDKRTLTHSDLFTPELVAKLTLQEETIDDALLAVQLLRQTPGIDPQRVFVLGHSLGAMAAPRIGQQDPTLAGLILLAGPTRPLEDVALDQFVYLYNLDGVLSEQEKASLEDLQAKVARAKDPNLSDSVSPSDLPLGIGAAYWRDLHSYPPATVAQALTMPLLILQGGRDYQVSAAKDFEGWRTALAGKANATLKLYPSLNHLFISGEGPSTPQEYDTAAHVDEAVVDDIAAWIMR